MPFEAAPGTIPQGVPRLDPDDPLNLGRMGAWIFVGGMPVSLLAPLAAPTIAGAGPLVTAGGQGGYASGGNHFTLPLRQIGANPPQPGGTASPWTWRLRAYALSWPCAYTALCDSTSQSLGNPGGIFVSAAGVIDYGSGFAATFPTLTLPTNAVFDLAVTGTTWAANSATQWFLNGAHVGSGAVGVNGISQGSQYLGNNPSGGGSNADCVYFALDTWTRALLPAELLRLTNDPSAGLVFPRDRLFLWATASAGGGVTVAAAAALAGEFVALRARPAALAGESAAICGAGAATPMEASATAALAGAGAAEWTLRRGTVAALPGAWLRGLAGAAATPAEALAALRAGAVIALESGGALALIVAADAALPLEWSAGAAPSTISLSRLLASPGRIRILASPGRRRRLTSPGRLRILKTTDR